MFAIFLLPNGTFVFELVIFIIVLGVVAKYILPPIQAALSERERLIREAQRASDESQHEADRLAREREEALADARAEARALLEAASREIDERKAAAAPGIQAEHDALLNAAGTNLAGEASRVRDEVGARLQSLVISAAAQVLGADIDPGRHRDVIDRALQRARQEMNGTN